LLKTLGYETEIAMNGVEAIRKTKSFMPDLVLLDIMMPEMDGYEVCDYLKSDPETANIPVVIVTGLSDRDSKLKGLQVGANDFLTKPIDRSELTIRVRNLLKIKEYEDFMFRHNQLLEAEVKKRTNELQEAMSKLISDITEKKMLEEQLEKARVLEEENLKFFSRRLIEVQEEERRAIARELHDEIGQSLTALKLSVEIIADSLPSEHADNIRPIEKSLGELLSTVRNISLDLRPAMLDELGLVKTLLWYFERYTSQTGISVDFIQTGADRRFNQQSEIALYRITQEAMTNVARYAEIMRVLVEFIIEQERVTVRIKDEGRGFDVENAVNSGSGLSIMRERAIISKGTFSLSSAPGKGTEITVEIPLQDN
jgi:signal transduction histidine kinase